jgi:hypothetical protein
MDVVLNIKHLTFPLRLLLISTVLVIANVCNSQASMNCFSFIPYGLDKKFVSLPQGRDFCFSYSNNFTYMTTNEFGARVIFDKNNLGRITAFGESQLLGLDFSDGDISHDLNLIFPNKNLEIYAAPNNGPFEVLEQIKNLQGTKLKGTNWLEGESIVIGFNYSTDIFRIGEGWNPKKFVPIGKKDLTRIFYLPGYHDILLIIARSTGKQFGSTVSNAAKTLHYYFAISDEERRKNIKRWLTGVSNSEVMKAPDKTLLIFPPYWYLEASEIQKKKIREHFLLFNCAVVKSGLFESVIISEFPNIDTKLAVDNRHYLSGSLIYKEFHC